MSHNIVPAWHLHTEVLYRVLASMHEGSSLASKINRNMGHTENAKQVFEIRVPLYHARWSNCMMTAKQLLAQNITSRYRLLYTPHCD